MPRSRTRRASLPISSWRTGTLSLTTSRRNTLFTWCIVSKVVPRRERRRLTLSPKGQALEEEEEEGEARCALVSTRLRDSGKVQLFISLVADPSRSRQWYSSSRLFYASLAFVCRRGLETPAWLYLAMTIWIRVKAKRARPCEFRSSSILWYVIWTKWESDIFFSC